MNLMNLLFCDIDGFSSVPEINPATGLPMIDGIGGVDVGGSPFGTDLHSDHGLESGSLHSDYGLESGSPFDPFGGGGMSDGSSFGGGGFSWD